MPTAPAWLRAVVVGVIGSGPGATWRRQHDEIEIAICNSSQPSFLRTFIEQIVVSAADEYVYLEDLQAHAGLLAQLGELLCY